MIKKERIRFSKLKERIGKLPYRIRRAIWEDIFGAIDNRLVVWEKTKRK